MASAGGPDRGVREQLTAEMSALTVPLRRLGRAAVTVLLASDPPPRRRGRWRQVQVAGWLLALVLFWSAFYYLPPQQRVSPVLVPLFALLYALPLLLAERTPLRAWRLMMLPAVFGPLFAPTRNPQGLPWPPQQIIATLVVLVLVALRHELEVVLAVWVFTALATAWAQALHGTLHDQLPGTLILLTLLFTVAYLIGARGRLQGRVAEGERVRDEERARRALLEERARIARELHDVVAHHMSMIAVQAETAPFRIPDLGEDGRECVAGISATAREALREMRRVLGVLRSEDDAAAALEPQPGLESLDGLVAGARRAGLDVDLDVTAEPGELPAAVGLSVYRIIQEGVSNAARHAPGAPVRITIGRDGDRLHLTVRNAPPLGPPPGPALAATAADLGHGLLGMRERVTMLDGAMEAGPTGDGGYRLRVDVPLADTAGGPGRPRGPGGRGGPGGQSGEGE